MKGKRIVVGVCGGIAAYKAAELVRLLVKADVQTMVAMSSNATRFVSPLTFEALSGHKVIWDMFGQEGIALDHISWAQGCDLIIVAPATANFIGKIAHGIADDFLSTMVLAATARILVCPSMNNLMFKNPVMQENLSLLEQRGILVMAPGQGELACHAHGPGRLPEPNDILEQAMDLLVSKDLSGIQMLITAGPTIEPIGPVRFISNRSSGKMGYALARAARRRGASVILVSGPTWLSPPSGVVLLRVKTAEEMRNAVLENRQGCHVVIKAAAVCDYRPKETAGHKIKKGPESVSLDLVRNRDILAELGMSKKEFPCVLVGFAAETQDLVLNAEKKLRTKHLDMIVANDVSRSDAGFGTDTNVVRIIHADGRIEEPPVMTKDQVADFVLDRVKSVLGGNS